MLLIGQKTHGPHVILNLFYSRNTAAYMSASYATISLNEQWLYALDPSGQLKGQNTFMQK